MSKVTDGAISSMTGSEALPRRNGELVFEEPWEGRAFGLAVAMSEGGIYEWAEFRDRFVEETDADENSEVTVAYYRRWVRALERLVVDRGLIAPTELESRAAAFATGELDDH